jgi:hypothetical protein
MSREKLQTLLYTIESLPLDTLQKIPELEFIVPKIYETLQIEDVCDHHYINGICICGHKAT